jgi:PPOX class probable F420-dependent enzyme
VERRTCSRGCARRSVEPPVDVLGGYGRRVPTSSAFADLGSEQFISLTTYRRSGVGVPTPVWIARDGDALVVTTPAGSGKVKRLRNNPRVGMRPCSRRGRVDNFSVHMAGVAEVITGEATGARLTGALRAKYGLQFRLVMVVERLFRSGQSHRVLLRITPA